MTPGMAEDPDAFTQFTVNKMAELQLKLIAINPDQAERIKLIDEFLTLWDLRGKL